MAIYTLRVLIANTFPQVRKIANALKSDHKVVYRKGQTVIFSFDSECNKDAAEHSRDILNSAIDKGGYIAAACLSILNVGVGHEYVADWEYRLNKGYSGDSIKDFKSEEEFESWANTLNLNQEI